jgi:tetratricopeptide (TPR) repeat protein
MASLVTEIENLTPERGLELQEAIKVAKRDKTEPWIGKVNSLSPISHTELKALLEIAQENYTNRDWVEFKEQSHRLVYELKLGPLHLASRFALALAVSGEYDEALQLAWPMLKQIPAEPSTYEAIARCLAAKRRFQEAFAWGSLSVHAWPEVSNVHPETVSFLEEMKRCIESCA